MVIFRLYVRSLGMRDPARIDWIIEELRQAWENSPDVRLGQLIHNAASMASKGIVIDLYSIDDDDILAGLRIINGSVS